MAEDGRIAARQGADRSRDRRGLRRRSARLGDLGGDQSLVSRRRQRAQSLGRGGNRPKELSLTNFLSTVANGKVASATIQADGETSGTLASGASFTTVIPTTMVDDQLLATLRSDHVDATAVPPAGTSFWSALGSWALTLLPFALLGLLWCRMARSQESGQGLFGVGKSPAKLFQTSVARATPAG